MALMRVLNYEDRSNIGWNYYFETDLMAYSLCGMQRVHGPIGAEVLEKKGNKAKRSLVETS